MTQNEAIDFIKENDRFLLSTHVGPDADGIGSILGIIGILKELGKTYSAIVEHPPQEKLSYLNGLSEIKTYNDSMSSGNPYTAAIFVDSAKLDLIGKPVKLLSKDAAILNIDHHISSDQFGKCNLVVPEAAASAQIVAGLFEKMDLPLDTDSAQALYAGLAVDTGRFRFDNTTPDVFRTAAKLVASGASPRLAAEKLYFQDNIETKLGLSKMLSTIELHKDGQVATAYMDYGFFNSHIGKHADSDGFVNQLQGIIGVKLAMLLKELEKGKVRVNLRSLEGINVNLLAGKFGGGGHSKASGCTIEGTIAEVKNKLLGTVDEFL